MYEQHDNACLFAKYNARAANGTIKTVAMWTMVDEHGEIELRDWSGANYQDSDYVDKSVRIKRVRVSSIANNSSKVAEFLPGRNGTKFIVAPRVSLMKWWLGDQSAITAQQQE